MKTVLLVTTEATHRKIYEAALRKHFMVEFSARASGGGGKVDAIVYDIPEAVSTIDLRWLKRLDIPVVVLTPEEGLRALRSPTRQVLTYPVSVAAILRALSELGVAPEGGGLVE